MAYDFPSTPYEGQQYTTPAPESRTYYYSNGAWRVPYPSGSGGGSSDWNAITNKPATYPPTLPIAQSGVTSLTTDLALKAPLASPLFTGDPAAPTKATAENSTTLATTAFVQNNMALKANAAHTHAQEDVTNLVTDLAAKAPLASPALTGTPTVPTAVPGTNSTQAASTAFVAAADAGKANTVHTHAQADVTNLPADLALKAPLASPAFSGTPTAPTPFFGDNTTRVPTTAFVQEAVVKANLTAQRYNRLINGGMQISQDPGIGVGTNQYGADQWFTEYMGLGPYAVITQRLLDVLAYRYRVIVTEPIALAPNDYLSITQKIEGINIVGFGYGGAGNPPSQQAVLRFNFKAMYAGNYTVSLTNSAQDRSYITQFTVASGDVLLDKAYSIVIPGDNSGLWLSDAGAVGIIVRFILATGSDFYGTLNTWQAGKKLGTSGNYNAMATTFGRWEVYNVGLHLDPSNTGVPPLWELPSDAETLLACQRYYFRPNSDIKAVPDVPVANSPRRVVSLYRPVTMRTTPIESGIQAGLTTGTWTFSGTANIIHAVMANAYPAADQAYLSTYIANARM